MNDTQALFERLSALAAYFEGRGEQWQEETLMPLRTQAARQLAGGRADVRIVRASEADGGGSSHRAPDEVARELLHAIAPAVQVPGTQRRVTASQSASAAPASGPASAAVPQTLRTSRRTADGMQEQTRAQSLSRVFARDARRYDE